jgi:tRNA1Val (adenine37-N6)-methyltransferase
MPFHFKTFSLAHEKSTLKIGTDSVLLASVIPVNKATTILDIGTGCGVIAFCLAYKRSLVNHSTDIEMVTGAPSVLCHESRITGIDIDADSIIEAQENRANFPVYAGQKLDFFHTSLQDFAINASSSYDLIVSNPPYFSSSLKPDNPRHLRSKHRDENLTFKELFHGVCRLLSQEGYFYMILPPVEQKEFDAITDNLLFPFERWEIFPNPHKPLHRLITGYSFHHSTMQVHQITIRNALGKLTDIYKQKTSLFYL